MEQHNKTAEETVIGALMLGYEQTIDAVAEILEPRDFYSQNLGQIYEAVLDMHHGGTPVDPITLSERLKKNGWLEDIGGEARLAYLASTVSAVSNAPHYADIVLKDARFRRLGLLGLKAQKLASDGVGEWDEVIAQVEMEMTGVTESGRNGNIVPITDGFEEYLAELRQAYATKTPNMGELTGFALDNSLMGLWPGQLVLIAARPAAGKSTLALNIAENFVDRGVPVLFVTLEMSKLELQIRSLARAANVDSMRLVTGLMQDTEAGRLAAGIKTIQGRSALHIEDAGDVTIQKLAASAARMKRQHNVGLVVVDYIQLMTPTIKSDNRAEQIGSISRGLKLLARRLDIPVVAAAQMNRKIEERKQPRPQLSDLRDSGSLEQDSDVVLFIHDDAAYDVDTQPNGEVEVIIAKNRRGSTGSVKMLYTRCYSKFHDLT